MRSGSLTHFGPFKFAPLCLCSVFALSEFITRLTKFIYFSRRRRRRRRRQCSSDTLRSIPYVWIITIASSSAAVVVVVVAVVHAITALNWNIVSRLFPFVCNSRMSVECSFSFFHFCTIFSNSPARALFLYIHVVHEIIIMINVQKLLFIQLLKHPVLVVFDVLLRSYSLALCMFWL